ncbi:MAG: AMP-binding protein [Gammaproteobacteria bacterium]|nr:AMP-binding protein [Gammaproteobacteria bacterium]
MSRAHERAAAELCDEAMMFRLFTSAIGILVLSDRAGADQSVEETPLPNREFSFIGSNSFVDCHRNAFDDWTGSHHHFAMQVASCSSVIGDFNDRRVGYFATSSGMFRDGEKYFMRTQNSKGELQAFEVSYIFCVPPMAYARRGVEAFQPSRLQHITAIFAGGAPYSAPQIREWLTDGIPNVDGFGMNEAGTVFGVQVIPDLIDDKAGCVGVPKPRVQARHVDSEGPKFNPHDADEMELREQNFFIGYWNLDDECVASRSRSEGGYYRMVDRRKDIYISGGENVYRVEIESVACARSDIEECAVVGVYEERWGEVGFLLAAAKAGESIDLESGAQSLADMFAPYELPEHALVIERLSRNAAGKVLKADPNVHALHRLEGVTQ